MRALTLLPAALVVFVAPVLVVPVPAAQAAAVCNGKPATIEATVGTVEGTEAADVIVVTGTDTRVRAGDGDDTICVVGGAGVISVDAGAGNDTVYTIEAGTQTDTVLGPGADVFVGGAQGDTVRSSGDLATDAIATGAGSDAVTVYQGGAVFVDLGPDKDILSFNATLGSPGSVLDVGTGTDLVLLEDAVDLDVDLKKGTIVQYGVTSTIRNAENIQAAGNRVVLRGDAGKNDLRAVGCRVDLHGGGGRDVLAHIAPTVAAAVPCPKRKATLRGDGGSDHLTGYTGNDVLIGGKGRDTADGGRGKDRCVAERTRRCER